ncbi:MAG: glycosyl hydrolase, partial [Cytophagaceae bacterium]
MNKRLLFLLLLTVLSLNLALAQRSPKRGIAYGGHSLEDMNALSPGISWWYNWSDRPDVNLRAYYASLGVEFVPMCWNNNFNVNDVIARIPQGAKYLLAYNEPNFYVEANMSPEFAASVWGRLEQIAAARGLQIVSACPAYCGGSACPPEFYDPNEWHRRFFEACPNCWVDYIAFHTYEAAGSGGGAISLSNNLKRWGRPIWVTEFADWYSSTLSAKTTWMNNVVNAYENDPDIFRYSWFTGRSSANPQINLLGANGQLTPLGENYLNRPIAKRYPAPGRIEAENHYRRNRTQLETCQDAGGGQNVSHTDAGDWVDYLIDVTTAGAYTFEFRVAGQGNGNINILVNEQLAKSNIALPPTGEWQTWSTVQVRDVILPEGMNLVRFHFNTGGVNLNFFNVVTQSNSAPVANFSATPLSTCTQNVIVFTDQSLNKVGNETFSWNFGAGATPATATGVGPHNVRYSTGGQKTVSLTVTNANGTNTNTKNNYITIENPPTGCIFSDDFTDNVVSWIIPGPFSFAETAGEMRVSNNGYGEWDNFRYQLNNGSIASSFNFQCAANKPVVKIRAKASANCLLSLSMRDGNGRTVDNYNAMNLELTTTYQTFTIDFAGRFRNFYSGNPGILDSTNITDLILAINPAYFSYPITGTSGRVYNSAFAGRVDIDWIGIGDNCSPSTNIVANFDANKTVVCTGEGVVFTNTTSNAPAGSTYSWNFGAGANPATATGVGPHTVTYSSNGLKTVSLVVSSNGVSNTRTRTDYINVAYSPAGCLFSDDYDNNTVSWISPLTGPFAHSESGTDWRITTNGHNEWDAFNYTINNGAAAQPLNFGCSSNKPVLRIRAKASANCLLSISMADINGRTTDAMAGLNNLELTTSYQTFTINYSGRFRNLYGASPGMLDSLIISRLSFMVNPGFASWPVTGTSGRVYNTAFIGNIDINWIGIGDNCTQTPAVVANFSANQTNTCTGTNITFTSSSTGTSSGTTYSWNFGSGANPATATGAGPHNVSYSTAGTKTVSLSLNGGAATETKTNYITVTASVTPSVSIAITSGSNPTCSGSSVTFTATPTNGGTAPTYQWRINGTNVATGATLTRNNLNNGDQVSCVMTSNAT